MITFADILKYQFLKIMETLITSFERLLKHTNTDFVRYLYSNVAWNNRLVGINTIFEVGGKNKSSSQIKNVENAYIAADNIETGFANKIPLWLFGFLY